MPKNINKSKRDRHKNHNSNNNNNDDTKSNTFHVPRNLDIQLETAKVLPIDVIHLRYFTEYQWLVDFSLYSAIVYTLSEVSDLFICNNYLVFYFYFVFICCFFFVFTYRFIIIIFH